MDNPGDRAVRWILHPTRGPWILGVATVAILLVCPGASSLWTLEGRTAVICREMMRSGDYFHPYLFDDEYFDKPLLPYWMIIGVARLTGRLDETAMRLPGILAAVLTVLATARIGRRLFRSSTGLIAGWLLTTCFVFVYWARVAGADILNVAAVLVSVAWYVERRDRPGFISFVVFLALLAVGAHMKGLIAPVLVSLAILPDLARGRRWRLYLRPSLFVAALPAVLLYLAPFLVSSSTAEGTYRSSGLVMAFRENVVRYFQPFDHQAPFYEYLLHLPLYALPWTFFLPAVLWRARQWKGLEASTKGVLEAVALMLLFLTLGGSRRHYYMLPVLPFLMVAVADWLRPAARGGRRLRLATLWTAAVSAAGLLVYFGILAPILNARGGTRVMAEEVRLAAGRHAPWGDWKVVLFNTKPQMGFYLDPRIRPRRLTSLEDLREELRLSPRTVVVTYARELEKVKSELGPCAMVVERSTLPWSLGKGKVTPVAQVAFIPEETARWP